MDNMRKQSHLAEKLKSCRLKCLQVLDDSLTSPTVPELSWESQRAVFCPVSCCISASVALCKSGRQMTATKPGQSSVAIAELKDVLCKSLGAGLEGIGLVVFQPLLQQIHYLRHPKPRWRYDLYLQEGIDDEVVDNVV